MITWPHNKLTEKLGITYPVIQAPMAGGITTPALVATLGGEPGTPIADSEYDRLYLVVLSGSGAVTSLLRFGATASR